MKTSKAISAAWKTSSVPRSSGSTNPSSCVQYLEAAAQFQCNFTNTDKGLSGRERRMTPWLQLSSNSYDLSGTCFTSCLAPAVSDLPRVVNDTGLTPNSWTASHWTDCNYWQSSIYFLLQRRRKCLTAVNTAAPSLFDQCFGQFLCSCQKSVYNVMWNTLAQSCLVKAIIQELQEWCLQMGGQLGSKNCLSDLPFLYGNLFNQV